MLRDALARVRERIHRACQRCGRDPSSVTLVCVTKGIPIARIQEASALGMTDIGENRVQEARQKQAALGDTGRRLRWHLIGHLQRNKAKDAVGMFGLIHSVDTLPLVEELTRQAERQHDRPAVLLQVNVSGEAAKHGCRPDDAEALAAAVLAAPHLDWRGLMTMAPFTNEPEAARPVFQALRALRDRLQERLGRQPLLLSMGMSQDFEIAIEEGADLIRIGTALFTP